MGNKKKSKKKTVTKEKHGYLVLTEDTITFNDTKEKVASAIIGKQKDSIEVGQDIEDLLKDLGFEVYNSPIIIEVTFKTKKVKTSVVIT